MKKKKIFYCPGPEYLFYNTGIYCLFELSRSYSIVLLLDFPFEDMKMLDQLRNKNIIADYVEIFFNPKININIYRTLQRHLNYSKKSKFIFNKYRPSAIIQHSGDYPHNIYSFEEARSYDCVRIRLNASKAAENPDNDMRILHSIHISNWQRKYNIPRIVATVIFYTIKTAYHHFVFTVLPLIIKGQTFKPNIRAFPIHEKYFTKKINYFDYSLCYSESEKKGLSECCGEPVKVINNPLHDMGDEIFSFIYGPLENKNEILILPTSGEIAHVLGGSKMNLDEVVQFFYFKWSTIIDVLKEKYPDYKISIKLKPGQSDDMRINENRMLNKILQQHSNVSVVPADTNTQKLMLEAEVIVTSYSSVLWWANHLKDKKTLISLNVFGIPEGRLFSNTPGILYFENLEKFSDHRLTEDSNEAEKSTSALSLTEFMRQHIAC